MDLKSRTEIMQKMQADLKEVFSMSEGKVSEEGAKITIAQDITKTALNYGLDVDKEYSSEYVAIMTAEKYRRYYKLYETACQKLTAADFYSLLDAEGLVMDSPEFAGKLDAYLDILVSLRKMHEANPENAVLRLVSNILTYKWSLINIPFEQERTTA